MVFAAVQTLSDSRRTSFVGSKRPSRFQSASVPSSTGPYSFSPTRTSHRSAIARLIAKEHPCHPERGSEGSRRVTLKVSLRDPSTFARNDGNNSLHFMKLLLIDGHYYVYRSFFAIPNLSNSRGEPTNAIFGFTKT